MPTLNQAIDAREAMSQLQATEAEWKRLSSRQMLFLLGGIGAILAACPLGFSVASIGQSMFGNPNLILIFAGLFTLAVIISGVLLIAMKGGAGYAELEKVRKTWQAKIPNLNSRQQYEQRFGGLDTNYVQLRTDREQLIQHVMGQLQGYTAFLSNSTTNNLPVPILATSASAVTSGFANIMPGPNNTWNCSACRGYIRQDAEFCKHCKARFQT